MAKMSPTQRSLRWLRDEGWPLVQVVEYYHAPSRKHRDLFGFCDILAFHPHRGHLYVQTTSGANTSTRVKKIQTQALEPAEVLLSSKGTAIEVHGWRKLKRQGNTWQPKIVQLDLCALHSITAEEMQQARTCIVEMFEDEGSCTHVEEFRIYYAVEHPPGLRIEVHPPADIPFSRSLEDNLHEVAVQVTKPHINRYASLRLRKKSGKNTTHVTYILRPDRYLDLLQELDNAK